MAQARLNSKGKILDRLEKVVTFWFRQLFGETKLQTFPDAIATEIAKFALIS